MRAEKAGRLKTWACVREVGLIRRPLATGTAGQLIGNPDDYPLFIISDAIPEPLVAAVIRCLIVQYRDPMREIETGIRCAHESCLRAALWTPQPASLTDGAAS